MKHDAELAGYVIDRQRLLRQLGPVLRRVGPSNPRRAKINARQATIRRRLHRELRANANAIAARVLFLHDSGTL